MATMRPMTSTAGSGRFSEAGKCPRARWWTTAAAMYVLFHPLTARRVAGKPSDGRVHSKVNHFEPGADDFTYGGMDPSSRSAFGSHGARFVESTVVHQGLIDGYTAAEAARGIKPGRLVGSNATSASNPLATSAYQVMEHLDSRAAPKDWRTGPRTTGLAQSNATSTDNPLATSMYQVRAHVTRVAACTVVKR